MIKLGRARRVTAQDEREARNSLQKAQDQELRAREKVREVQPIVKRLERHLEENNFGRLVWAMYKGAR